MVAQQRWRAMLETSMAAKSYMDAPVTETPDVSSTSFRQQCRGNKVRPVVDSESSLK